jgi:MFS superfamily sulfate permease-like transporter
VQLGAMFAYPKQDLVAGIVVFLVALPLCLGIAVACGVPPVMGLVAGIVGGLVVPFVSRSSLSVSGPAAGLTAIVVAEVEEIGLEAFLAATALSGGFQVLAGTFRAGRYSALVPSSVIKGMLAAIGITIILKQIPVAAGVSTLSELPHAQPGALLVTGASLVVLFGWPYTPFAKISWLPAALLVVVGGTALAALFHAVPALALPDSAFVSVPEGGLPGLVAALPRPDFASLALEGTWVAALTIAVVASLETLLSLQAVDRLDPLRRKSPPDRELVAQGLGNAISGLLGGLPMTAVIVRSGANIAAGGRERMSAVVHALLLVVAVLALAPILNEIPLACLAAILLKVGLGLCPPKLVKEQWDLGFDQFLPFAITIAAILYEDLLIGVSIGLVVGVIFVLRQNANGAVHVQQTADELLVSLRRDGTFVTKPAIQAALDRVPEGGKVTVDATGEYLDHDVKELLATWRDDAVRRGITVDLVGIDLHGIAVGGGH